MMGSASNLPQDPVVAFSDRITVEIKGFDFVPKDLTVSAGATVTWVNRDNAPHDATESTRAWTTDRLKQGERASLQFEEPGTFEYRCSIHTDMTARLAVRPDSAVFDDARTARSDREVSHVGVPGGYSRRPNLAQEV
jgi:plastocyanin